MSVMYKTSVKLLLRDFGIEARCLLAHAQPQPVFGRRAGVCGVGCPRV